MDTRRAPKDDMRRESSVVSIRELNSVWREVLSFGTRQHIAKGTRWTVSPSGETFGFLSKGLLRLSAMGRNGSERIVLYIERGCIFNEQSCLASAPLSFAAFFAMEDCEVWNFPRTLLNDRAFAASHPDQMLNLIQSLSQKTGALFGQLDENSSITLETAICRRLYRAVEREGNVVKPHFSQTDLALSLGLHRSTVCRVLSSLRQRGILGDFTKTKLEILDKEALFLLCNMDND